MLQAKGLFDARVPRYTSYPTAPVFSQQTGAAFQAECLRNLDPAEPVSVYVHIPFCERLCWFCACRTQGTRTLAPVERYVATLEAELGLVARMLPAGLRMGRLHWGGGTPTILSPALIRRLAQAIRKALPPAEEFEFSVEIDPTLVDGDKVAALRDEGMSRASIGIQDFSLTVQTAIGREQSFEITRACVDMLRKAGITSLNTDLVYGLPHQDAARIVALGRPGSGSGARPRRAVRLRPCPAHGAASTTDRRRRPAGRRGALPAGRHWPPNASWRRGTAPSGSTISRGPATASAVAAESGHLRRNFQGYTADTCQTLLGLGASSISRFADGYVQNASATAAYIQRIEAGELPAFRGHKMTAEDKLRARAIEMLMCDFHIDQTALRATFGADADWLVPIHAAAVARFDPFVSQDESGLTLLPEGRALARLVARLYDAYATQNAIFSKVS